jgi:hypothetical protein
VFAASYYRGLEASAQLTSFYLTVVMRGVQQKKFGRYPKPEPQGGMSMPMDSSAEPLLIPSQPLKIARSELGNPNQLAVTLITLVERTFRAQGRLYPP